MNPETSEGLVQAYTADADYLLGLMERQFRCTRLLRGRGEGAIPKSGTLAEGVSFEFHGAGCRFQFGPKEVDLEFQGADNTPCFDAWRLWQYSKTFPPWVGTTVSVISAEVDELCRTGVLNRYRRSASFVVLRRAGGVRRSVQKP